MGIRLEGRGFSGKIDRKNVPVPKKEGMALFREQRVFFQSWASFMHGRNFLWFMQS